MDGYTVGEVARLAHISVRTLHHYDGIGLLAPSGRSPAGYRLYSEAAGGQVAMDLAEAHRQHLTRWFYDCGYEMHRGLAHLYTSDARYTAPYDEIEPGLSGYVRDAILANADRGEGPGKAQEG